MLRPKKMARNNYAMLRGCVSLIQESTIAGKPAITILLRVELSGRDEVAAYSGYRLKCAAVPVQTSDPELIQAFKKVQPDDVVQIKGFVATKRVTRHGICPNCGADNARDAAVQDKMAGGLDIYIIPQSMLLLKRASVVKAKLLAGEVPQNAERAAQKRIEKDNIEDEGKKEEIRKEELDQRLGHIDDIVRSYMFRYLKEHREDGNQAFILGNLTNDPVCYELDQGKTTATRYQIAMNRKFKPYGADELLDRTDYPWVYSYGQKAINDYERLKKGSLVFIDGAIHARKYKETYKCPHCGQEYVVPGRTLEILSYDTEYLRDFDSSKDKGQEN